MLADDASRSRVNRLSAASKRVKQKAIKDGVEKNHAQAGRKKLTMTQKAVSM